MNLEKGEVLRIEKTSIHDGNGLRTVVFLQGCPLRCKWCSTPESQKRCVTEGQATTMTVDEVIHEISKDEIFFFHSGGGVTLSGGEVLMQADFAGNILRQCRNLGIETAIETSLYADFSEIEKVLPYFSFMYIDFKVFDEDRHIFYTGVSNKKIKENLQKISQAFHGGITIRIPVVPSVNLFYENMEKTARFLTDKTRITHVELLPYHRLGLESYHKLKRPYELKDIKTPTEKEMQEMARVFLKVNPNFVMKIKGQRFSC